MDTWNIFRRLGELILHCILWYLTIRQILIPIVPFLLLVLILRTSEGYIYNKIFNATAFAVEEIPWNHKKLKNLPVINVIMLMDKQPNLNQFQEVVESRMLDAKDECGRKIYPRGRQYMAPGFLNFYWVNEDKFDIKEHVYEQEEVYASMGELQGEISRIATVPFDKNISPWEFRLLKYHDNSDHDDSVNEIKSAIMFRIHHSMADGGSLIYFLLNVLSDEVSLQIKPRRFTNLEKFYVYAQAYLNIPLLALKQLLPYTPSHSLHCVTASGNKTFTWSDPISLLVIQSIKKKLNVTINDVMVGTLATCFHEYFVQRHERIPKELMTAFPVDVRSNISEAKSFSNKFAILPVPLPTASGDVIKNIRSIHAHMNEVKEFGVSVTYHAGMCAFNYFLPDIINDAIQSSFIKKTSLVLSNVAGPQVPVTLGGNEVKSISFWPAPKYDMGMSCSLFSYKDSMTIGFSWDNALSVNVDDILKRIPIILYNLAASLERHGAHNQN